MSQPQDRVDLDWLRGLAALAVAALHARELTWIGLRQFHAQQAGEGPFSVLLAYLCAPIMWGSAGVSVFFVISGYVIHAAAARKLARDAAWRIDVRAFYTRRFVRIYAVLLLALVVTYLLDGVSRHFAPAHPNLRDVSFLAFLGNLAGLQGSLVPVFGSNGPLWTLAIEIHFYLVYPLLLIGRRRLAPSTLLGLGVVLSIGSALVLAPYDVEVFTSYYGCWLLGFYAAELRATGRRPLPQRSLLPLAATCAAFGCAVFFVSRFAAFAAWSLAMFLYLLRMFDRPPARGRLRDALGFVGAFSFTLYAVHEPIVLFLVCVLNHGGKSASMLVPLATLALVGIAAYLLYLLVEKRTVAWLGARGVDPTPGRELVRAT